MMDTRRFPIQGGPSILWSVVAPYEAQAQRNHGQSLERLAERHGLSPYELCCLLDNKRGYPLPDTSIKDWEEPYRLRLVAMVEAENAVRKALENLSKSSAAVHDEIMEFEKPVSPEIFEWWQQAMLDAEALRSTQT